MHVPNAQGKIAFLLGPSRWEPGDPVPYSWEVVDRRVRNDAELARELGVHHNTLRTQIRNEDLDEEVVRMLADLYQFEADELLEYDFVESYELRHRKRWQDRSTNVAIVAGPAREPETTRYSELGQLRLSARAHGVGTVAIDAEITAREPASHDLGWRFHSKSLQLELHFRPARMSETSWSRWSSFEGQDCDPDSVCVQPIEFKSIDPLDRPFARDRFSDERVEPHEGKWRLAPLWELLPSSTNKLDAVVGVLHIPELTRLEEVSRTDRVFGTLGVHIKSVVPVRPPGMATTDQAMSKLTKWVTLAFLKKQKFKRDPDGFLVISWHTIQFSEKLK